MDKYKELLEKAKQASQRAYAPYSKFPVGACILYNDGREFLGCNVENASYGLSLCAERNAMSSAIVEGEISQIEAIAIYSPVQKKCLPCGACRQWICEFATKNSKIILEDDDEKLLILTLEEIFPYSFKFDE